MHLCEKSLTSYYSYVIPLISLIYFSFWEYGNVTCQPRNTWKEECIDTYGCLDVIGLECDANKQCDCVDLVNK